MKISQFPLGGAVQSTDLIPIVRGGQDYKVTAAAVGAAVDFPGTFPIPFYGAVGNGVTDDSGAINSAIVAASFAGGGTVYFPGGKTYAGASPLTLASNVQLSGYGATYKYTGTGAAIDSPTINTLNTAGIQGLTIDGGSTASVLLQIYSGYACYFRDLSFLSDSLSNTVISLLCNTTGTNNPTGNKNTLHCTFDNITQTYNGTGKGCGTFLAMTGNTSLQGFVTDNTFINCQAHLCNVYGINFVQWCDSNIFTGMTRIGLNGNISPANGIGVIVSSGAGGGVYAETFEMLAIDTFAVPATDNRQGVVATNGLSPKFINIQILEYGPAQGLGALNIPSILSGAINQAPRALTNYQSYYLLGCNVGLGVAPNVSVTAFAGAGAWQSGAAQYVYFAQASCSNTASALGASYACQPGAVAAAGPYTVSQVMGYYAAPGLNGANATTTNVYGFFCADQTTGAVGNYGYYSNVSAGANKFGFYGAGTANSYLGGGLKIEGGVAIPAGGTLGVGYEFSSAANFGMYFGSGAPSLVAGKGSLYLRSDGVSNVTRMYVATDSGGTWTAVNTVA